MILKSGFARLLFCFLVLGSQANGAPVISGFTPTAGTTGDQVTLSGSGFSTGGITVRFWNGTSGVIAPIVFPNSDSQMTVAVPSGITTGPISIQQGTASPFYTSTDFLAIGFGPYITGFSPLFGSVNDTVIITGVHLTNAVAVMFNRTNATDFSPNAAGTQITTRVPFGATSGPLTVSTIYGTSNSPASFSVIGAGPFITDFSPVSGDSGTKVLIDGVHFTGVTNVTFNGKPGVILSATSDTLIQVAAPLGLTTGPIAVYTVISNWVTSSNFFGKPTVTGFAPRSGRAGTNVLITGTNFIGASAISFGGVSSGSYSVLSNSNILAAVPTGAITGLIRVTVPGASAFSSSNFVVKPTVFGFAPAFGPPGTPVVITGANFNVGTPIVRFNGIQAANVTGISFGQLTAQVPSATSTGPISVTTTDGSDTNASLFYLPAVVRSFTPTNSPPGSRVSITGTNFIGTTAVSFNGTPAASFIVSNNNSISAIVPTNLITGPITVTTPAGTATNSALFYGAPIITSFTPSHGLPGTNVIISGVNFLGGTVQFSGVKATPTSLNNTQVLVAVPNGAQTGPITIAGPAGTNTSPGIFTLDYPNALHVKPAPLTSGFQISWPVALSNYVLQFDDSLTPGSQWLSVTSPATISGGFISVVETNSGPTRFYRLHP